MKKKLNIERMQQLATEHGGKCLSSSYVDIYTHLLWQCAKRHTWQATPSNIRQGTWCPVCAFDWRRNTIEKMQRIALERRGKCLSERYSNAHTKLLWQCMEGHIWQATPHNIQKGVWCPFCWQERNRRK
jgi:hypothetical protein